MHVGQPLVDDHRFAARLAVAGPERAAAHHLYAECIEVSRADRDDADERPLLARHVGPAVDLEAPLRRATERQVVARARALDGADAVEPIVDLLKKQGARFEAR